MKVVTTTLKRKLGRGDVLVVQDGPLTNATITVESLSESHVRLKIEAPGNVRVVQLPCPHIESR